jgi:hypothetical protein
VTRERGSIEPSSASTVAWLGLLAIALGSSARQSPDASGAAKVDFARDVRPILEARCYACHGEHRRKGGLRLDHKANAFAGSSFGKVIEPGDAAKSALVQRIASTDPDERMPLGKEPLGAAEIALLRAWIDQGASWPDDGEVASTGATHWAYVKPVAIDPPHVAGVAHPVDRFIRARLQREGLAPSPPADRATLIRRASLDLTGIPPTLEEVDAFVRDARPDAYERVVDRLLASPRYGERQAQRWLDLARYADTNGYEKDERRTMWRYRDWVIDAFNANMPFDEFTIEQIAGDLLPDATLAQKIATGFHRNTLMNEEGGADPEEFRNAAVVDRVNTTATVWLGTTLGCAQCHNHKFDPFSTKEYYQLFAFFDGTADTGNKNDPMIPAPTPAQAKEEQRLVARVGELEKELAAPDADMDREQARWMLAVREHLPPPADWHVLIPSALTAKNGSILSVQDDGAILATGDVPEREVYSFVTTAPIERADLVRIEVQNDESLPMKGPGRAPNGNFVLTNVEISVVGSDAASTVPFGGAQASFEQDTGGRYRADEVFDRDAASGWAIGRGGSPTRAEELVLALKRDVHLSSRDKLRIQLACESPFGAHVLGRFRVSVAANPALAMTILPPETSAWRVVGPFKAASQAEALATKFPPEVEIVAKKELSASYDAAAWTEKPEWFDRDVHALEGENCAHYLVRTVHCDAAMSLALFVGADDALKLWLDGDEILQAKEMQGTVADQHRVEVKLTAGDHTLALKVVNGGGQYSFFFDATRDTADHMPLRVVDALLAHGDTDEQRALVRDFYRRTESPRGRTLGAQLAAAEKDLAALRAEIPTALVLRELDKPRKTRVHVRGSFLSPGEEVQPGVPHALNPLRSPDHARPTRLDLARWLVDPDNPLTARVVANRAWEDLFGRGLVATSDDFGTRGEPPSHPELLDWLATELVHTKWDMKALVRTIVTSETYEQSSRVTPEMLERDPKNVLLERAPRTRLDVETLRDCELAIGGLLVEKIGGPSVMPPQPDGIWSAAYSGDQWKNATGSDRYRRGLYTFWRRSSPYATYGLFDAPSRELACTRRPRTNTPLQALALLDDPAFVECAAGLAQRMMSDGATSDADRIARGFRLCTSREPSPGEIDVLAQLAASERERLSKDPAAASKTIASVASAVRVDDKTDPAELAAWISVGNVLLNLDETVTRN